MIDQIRIQNFKCLRDVRVDLAPLTVLIGPNNSGKTSLLEAISLLGETTHRPLIGADPVFGGRLDPSLVWRRRKDAALCWQVQGTTEEPHRENFFYELAIENLLAVFDEDIHESFRAAGRDYSGNIPFNRGDDIRVAKTAAHPTLGTYLFSNKEVLDHVASAAGTSLRSSQIYKFDASAARTPSAPTGGLLNARGDNLAAVLDALVTGPERASFDALEKTLTQTFPDLAGIALPSSTRKSKDAAGQQLERLVKSIEFVLVGKERPKLTIPASRASDGVMLLTAYLALAYSDTPEIILLEEPENGLHPGRLKMVLDLLRKMTSGEVGNRRRQIILTTHSPLLLNYCEKEEVRIVRRGADGGSEITPLSAVANIDQLLNEFAIGELWNLLGEEGLLKDTADGAGA